MGAATAYGGSDLSAFSAVATGDQDLVAQASSAETPETAARPAPTLEIENIVVSSRKRNERVQRIPISITALNQDNLREIGANRIPLISPLIPNADFTFQGGTSARLTIRGLAEFDPNPAVDAAVGTYVDGVYQSRAQSGQQALYDVERIEVLRGPQGTIFGKNALGGAINIKTNEPSFQREGEIGVKVGNFKLFETRGMVNLPIAEDRLAARVSLATNNRDGFQAATSGPDRDNDKLLSGRVKLLYFPTESLELLLGFDQSDEDRRIAAPRCGLLDASQINNPLSLQSAAFALGYQDQCSSIGASSNPRRVAADVTPDENIRNRGASFRATYALAQDLTFTSLTAFRQLKADNPIDVDGTAIDISQENFQSNQKQYTQEFQLTGTANDGRLEYLLGLFYFDEFNSSKNPNGGFFTTVQAADVVNPFPITGDFATDAQLTADALRGATENGTQRDHNASYSAYGQLRYNLTPALQFVGGLRLETDHRQIYRLVATTNNAGPCFTSGGMPVPIGTICSFYNRATRTKDLQPSASLNYRFTENALGYISYATGFKASSFNARSLNNDAGNGLGIQEPVDVNPAKLTTYEIGTKATMADGRLQVNAAAFYSLYDGVQTLIVSSFVPGSLAPGFGNSADSIITGAELETLFLPTPNLKLGANFGVTKDRYTRFDEPFVASQNGMKLGNGRLPFVSPYSYAFSADYLMDTNIGQLSVGSSWTGRTKTFYDPENSGSIASGKYGLLTGRLDLALTDGLTEISIVGTNLLDREYNSYGLNFSGLFGSKLSYAGAPRQYGIEIRRRF